MNKSVLLVSILLLPFTGLWADPPSNYPFLAYDKALKQAKQQNKKIFLYFGRYGCGYCEKTNKETFSDARLRSLYIKNYVLVYIDAESGDRLTLPTGEIITESELGVRLKVKATPVFVYLDSAGQPLFRVPGFKTVADFMAFDRYVQGGHYKTRSINEFLSGKK